MQNATNEYAVEDTRPPTQYGDPPSLLNIVLPPELKEHDMTDAATGTTDRPTMYALTQADRHGQLLAQLRESSAEQPPAGEKTPNPTNPNSPVAAEQYDPRIGSQTSRLRAGTILAHTERLDIVLAMDEYIDSKGPWGGSNPSQLKRQILGRIATPDPIPFFIHVPKPAQDAYKQLMEKLFDLHTNATDASVASIETHAAKEGASGMISTGWEGHAVGVYFRQLRDTKQYEIAIENTGQGCHWHGAPSGTPNSDFHAEVAGVFVFRPVTQAVFHTFVGRLLALHRARLEDDARRPALFYRCVCNALWLKDGTDATGEIYKGDWTPPWKHPGVAYFMRLPLQKGGDCAFRSVFFTALASHEIVHRDDADAAWGPPKELVVPAWFMRWYAALVAISSFVIVKQNETDKLGLTGPDVICLHDRLESLALYMEQASAHTSYPAPEDKAALRNAIVRLRVAGKVCNACAMGWYAREVMSSTQLLSDEVHVHTVVQITDIMPNVPTTLLSDDVIPTTTIASDNTMKLWTGETTSVDIRVAMDACAGCVDWTGIDKVATIYLSMNDTSAKTVLARADIVMLSQMLHRMLTDAKLTYEDAYAAKAVVRFVLVITRKTTHQHRQNDMMLLYGLLYIVLCRHLPALLGNTNTALQALLANLFLQFGPEVNRECFDIPVYSRHHADMIGFVRRELREVRVMTEPSACTDALCSLYFAVGNTNGADAFNNIVRPTLGAQITQTDWLNPMIFLTASIVLRAPPKEENMYVVQLLLYLASLFNIGWFHQYGQPVFFDTLDKLEVLKAPANKARLIDCTTTRPCDFFNPTNSSIELLFDPLTHVHHGSGAMFRVPADFMLRYGLVGPVASELSLSISNRLSTLDHALYTAPDLTFSLVDHLPAYQHACSAVKQWIDRLLDKNDPLNFSCDRQEWNVLAYALVYLDSLYRRDESHPQAEFERLLASPRCGSVLKALVPLVSNKSNKDRPADATFWATVMNGPLPVRMNGYTQFGPSGDPTVFDPVLQSVDELAHEQYASPDDDVYFDLVLTHACHVVCQNWLAVKPPAPVIHYPTKDDLSIQTHGHVIDAAHKLVAIVPTADAAVFESTLTCYQHFGRQITYDVAASALHGVSDTSFIPVAPRLFKYRITEPDGWSVMTMLEPLPPHPYFQTHFVWTPDDDAWRGEPSTSNRLKLNNYCLRYDPKTKRVEQAPPHSGRCDMGTLLAAKEAAVFVPMPTVFLPPAQKALLPAHKALLALCARLLSFCYSDRIVVWRSPDESCRVEVLSHAVAFSVAADGTITYNGMEVLRDAPAPEWRFWTYQIPSVFLVAEKLGDVVSDYFLLSMDVHRLDPNAIASTCLHKVFGSNDNPMGSDTPGKAFREFHTKCMARAAEVHAIKLHRSGIFLLPTTSHEALGSLMTNADRFGRTDVVKEVKAVALRLSMVSEGKLPEPAKTNFARDPDAAPYNGPLNQPVALSVMSTYSEKGGFIRDPKYDADDMLSEHYMWLEEPTGGRFVDETAKPLAQRWVTLDPYVPPIDADYRTETSAATSDVIDNYLLITRSTRQGNVMRELRPHIANFLKAHDITSMPLGYAQFMYIQNKMPRPDQIQFASAVTTNFAGVKHAQIHNVIMGAGKTSIITPLIILNSIYGIETATKATVVLVTPSKLREQTLRLLLPIGIYMDVPLRPVKGDKPHFWEDVSDAQPTAAATAPTLHGGKGPANRPTVFVASDRALKESLIKRNSSPPGNFRYLLDEVDMVMNPFTSELNIPQSDQVKPFCEMLHQEKKGGGGGAGTCMRPIIDFMFQKLKLASVHPSGSAPPSDVPPNVHAHLEPGLFKFVAEREHRLHYGMPHVPAPVVLTVELLIKGGPKDMVSQEEHAALQRHHNEDGVLAIPYVFADVPSIGSEFSDPLLTVAFTIESLLRTRLDVIQLKFWLSRCFSAADPLKFAKGIALKYLPFKDAPNKWRWVHDSLETLQKDDELVLEYLQYYVPLKLTVYKQARSACGLDLVMSKRHPLRAGFTGTPENVTIVDENPIVIKPKEPASEKQEAAAMGKLSVEHANGAVVDHICRQVAGNKYSVIIDVGSQFLGVTPEDLLCEVVKALPNKDTPLELVYWDSLDRAMVLDRTGTVSPWSGTHRRNQVVFYDHSHTTGTDAVLMPDTKACITLRSTTRYRDFIQGLFRLRNILAKQTCTAVTNLEGWTDIYKMTSNLAANDAAYVASQSATRAQHNALALVRSVGRLETVETPIDYLRTVPFREYLVSLLQKSKLPVAVGSLVAVLNTSTTPASMDSQVEQEKESQKEQQKEQEQEQEQAIVNPDAYNMYMFETLLKYPQSVATLLSPETGYLKLKNFDIFKHSGTTFGSIYRPLVVTTGTIGGSTTNVVVMMADAILLIDYLKQNKPTNVSVCITDRSNHVWFKTNDAATCQHHDEALLKGGGRRRLPRTATRSRPPCARRASRA